jgi:hypothetical protein
MSDFQEFLKWVMDRAVGEPLPKRVKLYRSLAKVCGSESDQKKLESLANDLQHADGLCRDLNFSFVQKQTDGNGETEGGRK